MSLRKALYGVLHGLFTREGQAENHRRTRPHTEHQRAVVARRSRRRRREDIGRTNFGLQFFREAGIAVRNGYALLRRQGVREQFFFPGRHRHFLGFSHFRSAGHYIRNGHPQGTRRFDRCGQHSLVASLFGKQGQFGEIFQTGFGNPGRSPVETAGVAVIIHPHGNDVFPVPAHPGRVYDIVSASAPLAGIATRIFRERPVLTHRMAVEPGLVGVVDGAQIQHNGSHHTLFKRRRDHHMNPVPAIAVCVIHQLFPGLVKSDLLPGTVVKRRCAPGGVVPFPEPSSLDGKLLRHERQCPQKQAEAYK